MTERRKVLHWVRRIKPLDALCAEQIISPDDNEPPTAAALLDCWGRAHWLRARTVIGRELTGCDVSILESSVSRRHAALSFDSEAATWTARDTGSTNGTFVEDKRIAEPTLLTDGCLLTIGDVGLVFHSHGAQLFERHGPESIKRTGTSVERATDGPKVALLGPVLGGGGVVEYDGTYVQLGPTQYSLVTELARKIVAERERSEMVRGFVSSAELLADLPWQTPYPEDNNVKQLVRRTRRAFDRAGLEDPIESRHGFGYRLRWIPTIEDD